MLKNVNIQLTYKSFFYICSTQKNIIYKNISEGLFLRSCIFYNYDEIDDFFFISFCFVTWQTFNFFFSTGVLLKEIVADSSEKKYILNEIFFFHYVIVIKGLCIYMQLCVISRFRLYLYFDFSNKNYENQQLYWNK